MTKNAWVGLAAGAVLLLATGCTDVTTEPQSTVSSANIFDDPSAYRAFLAKLYAGLSVTGQQGPAGAADIEGIDEGFSQYIRGLWQLQELPTDEAVIQWGDESLPELNTMAWGSANRFTTAFYARIFFQVSLANEFLRETTDAKLAERGVSASLQAQIQQYRAEARFLRALSYWHGMDVFGPIPLVTDEDPVGQLPEQAARTEIFQFLVDELTAIQGDLPGIGQAQYGRADRGAVQMLLAKMYLNAAAYGVGDRYAEALDAAETVIASGAYQLADDYMLNFLADNHTSPEIIFPVTFDGERTRTWGGTTYLVHAAVGGSMDPTDYGINGGWWGLRVTPEFVALFPAGDSRNEVFYTDGQTLQINTLTGDFTQGYAAPKYQNVTSDGRSGSNTQFPDTDFPMFRLADAYLIYAEACLRSGGGTCEATALAYVNALRERAYGDESGNITATELTLDFILDERARELWWEAHRRTDLIRYGLYTGGEYLWSWKGGVQPGQAVEDFLQLYPLPAAELLANPNLEQNPGY